MKLKNNNGFTGVDIAVSTVILIVFVSLITTMFYNLSVTSKKIERKTTATNLAIQTIEAMKIIDFDDLTETMTINEINNLIENKINMPNGYNIEVGVDNTKYPDVIKIISAQVNYKNGKNNENVKIETLVKNEIQTIIPKGIYASINGNTLSFFDNEEAARANADSDSHYYGNIEGQGYGAKYDTSQGKWNINIPWHKDVSLIKMVNIVDEIYPTDTSGWFYDCSALLQTRNIENLKTNKDTSMAAMFYNCSSLTSLNITSFNTSNVTDMQYMFDGCSALTNINVNNFDTSKVIYMNRMFLQCNNLKTLDLSNFNTSQVIKMDHMFCDCHSLTSLKITSFDTSKVISMTGLFARCYKLSSIDVSNFDTSNVTSMQSMFENCTTLSNLDLRNFNTSKVTTMSIMFYMCKNLSSINLSSFDTSNVTSMYSMFAGDTGFTTLDIRNFDTRKATNMAEMFSECSNLKTMYVSASTWSISQADYSGIQFNCPATIIPV